MSDVNKASNTLRGLGAASFNRMAAGQDDAKRAELRPKSAPAGPSPTMAPRRKDGTVARTTGGSGSLKRYGG